MIDFNDDNNDSLIPPRMTNLNKNEKEKKPHHINIPPLRETAAINENRKNLLKNRLGGIVLGLLISFGLMGVSFWWGFQLGADSNISNNGLPIVRSMDGPIKVLPEDQPRGVEIPHQDKLVLNNENEKFIKDGIITDDTAVKSKDNTREIESPIVIETDKKNLLTNDKVAINKNQLNKELKKLEITDNNEVAKNIKSIDKENITKVFSQKKKVNKTNDLNKVNNEIKESNNLSKGNYKIQLASYKDNNLANKGWGKIYKKHENLLKNLNYSIVEVNIPKKGKYYRLYGGPFNSEKDAKAICKKLKILNQGCIVIYP